MVKTIQDFLLNRGKTSVPIAILIYNKTGSNKSKQESYEIQKDDVDFKYSIRENHSNLASTHLDRRHLQFSI